MGAFRRFRHHPRVFPAIVLVAVLVLGGLGWFPVGGASSAPPPTRTSAAAPSSAPANARDAGPAPAAGAHVNAYQNDSSISNLARSDSDCFLYYGPYGCYIQAQDPTLVQLPNSGVGIGYSVFTTLNSTNFGTCPSANYTVTRAAFAASSTNGSTFGSPVYLPTPATRCDFVQQVEPTFAVSGTHLWGAYVATNATPAQLMLPAFSSDPPVLQWVNRTGDVLAIVNSTDNGTTWGNATVLSSAGNIANPVLTSFGKTLYLLYENVSNGTSTLPLSGYTATAPIAEELLVSKDDGATWTGPFTLPGENSSQFNNTMGGSLSVSSAGVLAVAYATNRSCLNYCYASGYAASGDDIVAVTSTTNGSTWSSIATIARGQGEVTHPYSPPLFCSQFSPSGTGLCALFQDAPMTSLTWGTGAHLYVTWEAAPFRNVSASPIYFYNYNHAAVYAGASNDSGVTWSTSQVSPPLSNLTQVQNLIDEQWFNPSIGYSNGTVYITLSYVDWGSLTGFQSFGNGWAVNTYSQWVATSANGITYSSPELIYLSTRSDGLAYYHDMGVHSSVGFTSTGSPLFAYALADGWFTNTFPGTVDFVVTLSVSSAYTGPTTTITFARSGLVNGTSWEFGLNGATYTATTRQFNVTGVPVGARVVISWPGTPVQLGFRDLLEPVISAPTFDTFAGPSTVWFNFTSFYGISFSISPNDYYLSLQVENFGSTMEYGYNYYWDTYMYGGAVYYSAGGNAFPWYLPSGTTLDLGPTPSGLIYAYYYTNQFVGYWNGTGNGSYTGSGTSANLTVNSAFNETLWDLAVGNYSEQFNPVGLPASSTYSFDVDGSPYSAAGTTPTVVPGLATGSHSVTNISATSTSSGWSYFGQSAGGNPIVVPIVPVDNLTFSFVNLSAAAGTVRFHAVGVTPGAAWELTFNGTVYSSTTPWLNLTAHPGTYAVGAGPVISANGTAALAPEAFGPTLNVSTGATYDINYSAAYQVALLHSAGGTVSPPGNSVWVATNGSTTITATPLAGYSWGGWTGVGPGSYTGMNVSATVTPQGPVQELASFVPLPANRFNLTVNETGLPAGTAWSVYLDGTGYSATSPSFQVTGLYSCVLSGSRGVYSVYVPDVGGATGTQYVPGSSTPSTACVSRVLNVSFSTEYALTVSQSTGGVVSGGDPSGINWIPSGSSLALQATPNSGYLFNGWAGTGAGSLNGTQNSIVVTPLGPVSELAQFVPKVHEAAETFTVTFTASSSLPSGTPWSVVLNGSTYTGVAPAIVVAGIENGTYSYSVPTIGSAATGTLYRLAAPVTTTTVSGGPDAVPVDLVASYWVTVTAVGPGTVTGGGWVAAGQSTVLSATPNGTATFAGWSGAGNGSYSGTDSGPTVQPLGPVSEVATFAGAPAGATNGSSSPAPSSALLIAGLAIVGLAVGLVIGIVLARRGRPPTSGEASP